MKFKWQRLLPVLLAFTLVFGLYTPIGNASEQQVETISVHGTEETGILLEETNFTYEENATAFDVLVNTVGAEHVLYSESQYGKMITSINGLAAEDTYFWAFYINGLSAQVGADSYKVQEGDELSFHYVDWTSTFGESVSLKVTGNDEKGIITDTNLSFIDKPTAYDLLQVVIGPEKIDTVDTSYGKMINGIDGLTAEGTYYWAFYVNGEMATVGADSYKLQPGDKISFQFESWETPTEGGSEDQVEAPAISPEELQHKVDATVNYILANDVGDWNAVALKQAGKTIPVHYLKNLKALIKENEGTFSRVTDTERYTLGILAAGGNPSNIEGYNLVEAIYNGNLTKQGLNGVTYGLIALDSASFEVPGDALWTREKLVNYLLDQQNDDGGWSWDGSSVSDLDTTGMVLTALSNYQDEAVVKQSIQLAVSFLSAQYHDGKIDNSSTAAQVVIALSSLGLDAGGVDFTKNELSLISYLLTFQNVDGGFDWQGGDVSDVFSTAQGAQALVAYQLFLNGKGTLYQLPLVEEVPVEQPVQKGWILDGDKWYFADDKGEFVRGWLFNNKHWYYLDPTTGVMKTGWMLVNGQWYFLHPTLGYMVTGWLWDGSNWYFLKPVLGVMQTGWFWDGTRWYYLHKVNGNMVTNTWIQDGPKWYYVEANGVMAVNKWIGNDYVGADGAWIPGLKR